MKKTVDNAAGFNYLDLGKVYGVSEVTLNGEKPGCKWYGNRVYQLPEHLAKAPVKSLQIKITTTVGNYLKGTPENKNRAGMDPSSEMGTDRYAGPR